MTLIARVPEKINLICSLGGLGDVTVGGKLEGLYGFEISTAGGDVRVKKLRGDRVHISAGGIIHASDSIEGRSVDLTASGEGARVRAKLVNGSDVSIRVGPSSVLGGGGVGGDGGGGDPEKLDLDDSLASVDVGSLYMSQGGDGADVSVLGPGADDTSHPPPRGSAVRVKSSHGHVSVRAVSPPRSRSAPPADGAGRRLPLVDLGGVNGSCEISVVSTAEEENDDDREGGLSPSSFPTRAGSAPYLAARVHVDSLTPDTVSAVVAASGDVEVTIDRKVEADVRLVSCPSASDLDLDVLLGDRDGEIGSALAEHDARTAATRSSGESTNTATTRGEGGGRISVRTSAFERRENVGVDDLLDVDYVEGHVENRSEEPDSRFDVRTRGPSTSTSASSANGPARGLGKINLEGAAAQALSGFSGGGGGADKSASAAPRPLLAVVSSGGIDLESVSWFGAIARRYGVEEGRGGRDLGRQASKSVPREDGDP